EQVLGVDEEGELKTPKLDRQPSSGRLEDGHVLGLFKATEDLRDALAGFGIRVDQGDLAPTGSARVEVKNPVTGPSFPYGRAPSDLHLTQLKVEPVCAVVN